LYNLITVLKGKKFIDNVSTPVGFRTIRFDADKGFSLNGKNLKLKGICMHHDAGTLGAAVPKEEIARKLDILKEMGCNAIRTSHNPFSPDFLDLCDQKGFLVIGEAFDEWELPKKKWLAGWNVGTPGKEGYADALDVAGYNYQEFRYEPDHKKYPLRPLYSSKNGMILEMWNYVADNEYVIGQFLWTGFEYLGEAGRFPMRSNTAGVIDLAGNKKPEFYFRQSLWSDKPMVFIGTTDRTWFIFL
jgi:hypothetical protein